MRNSKGQFVKGSVPSNKLDNVPFLCKECGISVFVQPYRKDTAKFCSHSCKASFTMRGREVSNETRVKIGNSNRGKKRTNEVKLLMSTLKKGKLSPNKGKKFPHLTGENNWRWISDRSQLAKYRNGNEYRNSSAHREWSKQVKNRDGWKCQISNGDCSGRVESHHILGWKDYPELRCQTNNGITLCHAHHPRKRIDEERYVKAFQELVAAKAQ